jgi:phytoene desaturase
MASIKKVAVIGAGLGGLSAAARLAFNGFQVDIYEQNKSAGGKANNLKFDGFRFDTGPSLLTMPFVLEELFNDCSERLSDYLELEKLELTCKYFFPDNTILNAFSDQKRFAQEIALKTSDSAESVIKYFKYSEDIYSLTSDLFLYKSPSQVSTYLSKKALTALLNLKKIDTLRTMHKANASFFKDKRTVQLFDRYATYNGSNPYLAPATLNIIQHVESKLGAYVPANGIYSISEAIEALVEKKGGNIFYESKVSSILTDGNAVRGIRVNEVEKEYDAVVSNADVNYTFKYLLNDSMLSESKKLRKLQPSLSGVVFYWGIKGTHKQLDIHNILFSEDYEKEFYEIFEKKICPVDPTVYIYISSKYNNVDAPAGCENWFVMINAPFNENQIWEDEIRKTRERIINKVNSMLGINIKDKIIAESILSPVEIESKTSSYRGSIYGISSNSKTAAFLRQNNKSSLLKGLYFCGGSAHPGGGIPLVILSGKIASELIIKYEQNDD